MSLRHRFLWENIACCADMAGLHSRKQIIKINNVGAAQQNKLRAFAHFRESTRIQKATVLGRDRGHNEDSVAIA